MKRSLLVLLLTPVVVFALVLNSYAQCTDSDGDGFNGEGGECGPVDCDDSDPNVHPGAEEVCNGIDDNCDGIIDDVDADLDGYTDEACGGEDCNDADPNVHPGAEEVCNGIDDNCDGETDEGCGYSAPANAEASTYGKQSLTASGSFNSIALFLVPVGAVIAFRIWRRKR